MFGAFNAQFVGVFGYPVGESPVVVAGGFIAGSVGAIRGIGGFSGGPDFVGVADVVSGFFEFEGVGGDAFVPYRALQDGAEAGLPEVLSREDGASAGGATRRGYKGVGE